MAWETVCVTEAGLVSMAKRWLRKVELPLTTSMGEKWGSSGGDKAFWLKDVAGT